MASVADRDRPRPEQVVAGHRRSDRAQVEQVFDRLVALGEDLFVHVAVGDLTERDDRRLVVLPVDHRMGAVRELASALRRNEHELEHVRDLLEAIFYGDAGHPGCPPWAQGLPVYFRWPCPTNSQVPAPGDRLAVRRIALALARTAGNAVRWLWSPPRITSASWPSAASKSSFTIKWLNSSQCVMSR